jgi:hypothetical protein
MHEKLSQVQDSSGFSPVAIGRMGDRPTAFAGVPWSPFPDRWKPPGAGHRLSGQTLESFDDRSLLVVHRTGSAPNSWTGVAAGPTLKTFDAPAAARLWTPSGLFRQRVCNP